MNSFGTGWLTYEKGEYLNVQVRVTDVVVLSLYVPFIKTAFQIRVSSKCFHQHERMEIPTYKIVR